MRDLDSRHHRTADPVRADWSPASGPFGFEPVEFLESPSDESSGTTIPSAVALSASRNVPLSEPDRRRVTDEARDFIASLVRSHAGGGRDLGLVIDELRAGSDRR